MMKLFTIALASIAILGFSRGAKAADPVVDMSYDWTGLYVGGVVGYGWADSEHCDAFCDPAPNTGPPVDSKGIMGGLAVGYNFQWDSIVLGVEGDYALSNVEGSTAPGSINGYGCGTTGCQTNIDSVGTVRARLGFAADNFMPYVTGGVAIMDVEGVLDSGSSETFVNAVAGGGIEFGFSDRLSLKVEYLHIFDNDDIFRFNGNLAVEDVSMDIARLGVNYRF